jgi:hypothetical protein
MRVTSCRPPPSTAIEEEIHMMKNARLCFALLALTISGGAIADRPAPFDDDPAGMCMLEDAASDAPASRTTCEKLCGPCEDAGGVCIHFPDGHCSCW